MKRITYVIFVITAVILPLSCVRDLQEQELDKLVNVDGQSFTVSLPPSTRTEFTGDKVVWTEGDSLWISNGTSSEAVVVSEDAWGQSAFCFVPQKVALSSENPTLYAVYPYSAAVGITDEGKLKVRIPDVQDGSFAHANIAAAAQTDSYSLQMVNLTAILKVVVPSATTSPVASLTFSTANNQALAGVGEIDLTSDEPLLSPTESSGVVSVPVNGKPDTYYVSVFPGSYDAGFRMTAVGTEPGDGYETRVTRVANVVRVNTMLNLGSIGAYLNSPFEGDGTASSPYILENLGHLRSLALMVNGGITFARKYLRLINDIEGVTMPVGCFPDADNNHPFQGDFDGGNHTLTLDINGADQPSATRLGLFGALSGGAHIHDLVIAGTVTFTGDAIGGLAGRVDGPANADSVYVENVTNKAAVSGLNYIGGLIGYATALGNNKIVIRNCSNEGKVTASGLCAGGMIGGSFDSQRFVKLIDQCSNSGSIYANANSGGMVGNAYYTYITNCENSGSVSAAGPSNGIHTYSGGWKYVGNYNRGTCGMVGFTQFGKIERCANSGPISGVCHVGGIAGVIHWTNSSFCSNSGTIAGEPSHTTYNNHLTNVSMVGGVVGFACGHASVYDSENSGDVNAHGLVGGVVGFIEGTSPSYNTAADRCFVARCKNSGAVSGTDKGVGGVVGSACAQQYWPTVYVDNCENTGAVKSTGDAVGGVVGMLYNNNTAYDMHVYTSKNSGSVEGALWVGGIVGMGFSRAGSLSLTQWVAGIRNCENSGDVLTTCSDEGSGEAAGGIIGTFVTGSNNPATLNLYNCLNTGSVMYKDASHKGVYVGGIVGRSRAGTIANVANHGYVGPLGGIENKAEGADARLGAIVGSHDGGALNHAYYFEISCSQAIGLESAVTDLTSTVVGYDSYGVLTEPVPVNGQDAYVLYQALNLWIGENDNYYQWGWLNGPFFLNE